MQDDDWFRRWTLVIDDVLSSYDYTRRVWVQLPFPGGMYEQEKRNPFTWAVWKLIIRLFLEEKKLMAEEAGKNAEDNA